jgi:phospholipid transport system substrate-binding protein
MRRTLLVSLALSILACCGASAAARDVAARETAPIAGPLETVRNQTDAIFGMLHREQRASADERSQHAVAVEYMLANIFDLREMATGALRGVAPAMTTTEHRESVTLFNDVLSSILQRIAGLLVHARSENPQRWDAPLRYRSESIDGDRAVVQATMNVWPYEDAPISLLMHRRGGQWLVYDLLIGGASFVDSYRAQFAAIVKHSTVAGLSARLREKQRALLAPEGAYVSP